MRIRKGYGPCGFAGPTNLSTPASLEKNYRWINKCEALHLNSSWRPLLHHVIFVPTGSRMSTLAWNEHLVQQSLNTIINLFCCEPAYIIECIGNNSDFRWVDDMTDITFPLLPQVLLYQNFYLYITYVYTHKQICVYVEAASNTVLTSRSFHV